MPSASSGPAISQTCLSCRRNALATKNLQQGKKASPVMWPVMAAPVPAPKQRGTCCSRAVQWLNRKHRAPWNASQKPATHVHYCFVASHLWACARQAQLWAPYRWDISAKSLLYFPFRLLATYLSSHQLNGCTLWFQFVPITFSFPLFEIRTVLCSFPTFRPHFVTFLWEAGRIL